MRALGIIAGVAIIVAGWLVAWGPGNLALSKPYLADATAHSAYALPQGTAIMLAGIITILGSAAGTRQIAKIIGSMSLGSVIGLIAGIGLILIGFQVAWAPAVVASSTPYGGDAALGTVATFPAGGVIGIIVTYLSARTPKPDDVQAVPDKPKTD